MRLKITFSYGDKKFFSLPCQYNEIVQGFIYRNLDEWIAHKIHDTGFVDPLTKRNFKLFTFSRLISDGRAFVKNGSIFMKGNITLTICSPVGEFIQSFASNLLRKEIFTLAENQLFVNAVEVEGLPEHRKTIFVKTLSPITVYSTLRGFNGKKKTYYFSPYEKEFEELILQNLVKKLRTLSGKTVEGGSIKPYKVSKKNERIVIYKDTVIKAWDGIFELSVPPDLFEVAFNCGLGAKNSQGFGCIEVWKK